VTVSRCILKLDGVMGYAMVMGSDRRHAKLAALFDAMLQMPDFGLELRENLIAELRRMRKERRDQEARDVRSSKVEFFTMKRGE
jgi:alpha-D-ribose 1-methylphosphonate 5-triphosphate synthase subunit PhnG